MFDSLSDQMRADENKTTTKKERIGFWVAVAAASVLVFAGLFMGVRLLE